MSQVFKGQIAQLKVEQRCAELSYAVSIPTTPERYDLIIDINGNMHRTQIKYADAPGKNRGSVRIMCGAVKNKPYTRAAIDIMVVYVPVMDRVLWLPAEIWEDKRSITLRYMMRKGSAGRPSINAWEYIW